MVKGRLIRLRHRVGAFYVTLRWRSEVAVACLRAWLHWQWIPRPVLIGITGSAGKTTTKDLCNFILSAFNPVNSNPGTLNDTMAISHTILAVNRQHRFCVLEFSAIRPGVLDWPLRLFKPKIGVLTCIEHDHFEEFKGKGIDGIAVEKAKLIEALPADGSAVLNIDDERVKAIGGRCRAGIIWVGRAEGATLRLLNATSCYPQPLTLKIEYQGKIYETITGLHGTHLALSVLCALGVALAVGLTLEQAIPRLAMASPTEGRMQPVVMEDGVTFLRDDMKSSYWSIPLPVKFLREANASRKIIVLGRLRYFSGEDSEVYKQLAEEVRQVADIVVFVGQNAHHVLCARKDDNDQAIQGFLTVHEAADYLREILQPGDLVLLKGSNKADHLERLVFNHQRPIECWRESCGFQVFCGSCPRLYQSDSTSGPIQETLSTLVGRSKS